MMTGIYNLTKRLTYLEVKNSFSEDGYELLTTTYINSKQILKLLCPNGHIFNISRNNWTQGYRCSVCSNRRKKDITEISKEVAKEGYTLLDTEYINNKTKLNLICPEGHSYSVSWDNWNNKGSRCSMCYYLRGDNSPDSYCTLWRDIEYKQYIKDMDGNKCLNPDCWKNDERLHIHHINYNKKDCGRNNLITLCGSCNIRANFDRSWHMAWYKAIINKRYGKATRHELYNS